MWLAAHRQLAAIKQQTTHHKQHQRQHQLLFQLPHPQRLRQRLGYTVALYRSHGLPYTYANSDSITNTLSYSLTSTSVHRNSYRADAVAITLL